MSGSRDIQDGPFCWQSKVMLRKIRDNVADMAIGSSVLKVYSALTEIASDEQSEIFETTQPHIASKALLSRATVQRSLRILEELTAVKIILNATPGSKMKAPSTYTLLAMHHSEASMHHGRKHGLLMQSRRKIEESKKNLKKKDPTSSSQSRCTQKEAEEFCKELGLPRSDGLAMFLHWEEKGWAKVKDWKLTIRKWKSFGYLPSQKHSKYDQRQSRPKEPAPSYPELPPSREPTEQEFAVAGKIARECTEKLRQQFRMNNHL